MTTTADDVWRLLAELTAAQKETERLLKEQSQEADQRRKEADHRLKETERLLKEQGQETDRQIREVNKKLGIWAENGDVLWKTWLLLPVKQFF